MTKYWHLRHYDDVICEDEFGDKYVDQVVNGFGGITIAYTYVPDLQIGFYGAAICSKKDQFCKKTGRMIAEERLKGEKPVEIIASSLWEFKQKIYEDVTL